MLRYLRYYDTFIYRWRYINIFKVSYWYRTGIAFWKVRYQVLLGDVTKHLKITKKNALTSPCSFELGLRAREKSGLSYLVVLEHGGKSVFNYSMFSLLIL